MLDADGRSQPPLTRRRRTSRSTLPEAQKDLVPPLWTCWRRIQIERHIRKRQGRRNNRLKKEVRSAPNSKRLGSDQAQDHLPGGVRDGRIGSPGRGRVQAHGANRGAEDSCRGRKLGCAEGRRHDRSRQCCRGTGHASNGPCPTCSPTCKTKPSLTRSTLVRILKESGRLAEFFAILSGSWTPWPTSSSTNFTGSCGRHQVRKD